MRSFLRKSRSRLAQWSGLNAAARRRLDGNHVVILNYHRVLPREVAIRDSVEEAMFVTPESFAGHLAVLKQYFRVLPLAEVVEHLGARETLPPRACAITFDDGWKDNFDYAYPALRRAELPATIFVVAERMGTLGAFWPDDVLRIWRRMSMARRAEVARQLSVGVSADVAGDADAVVARMKDLEPGMRDEVLAAMLGEGPPPVRELMDWSELAELQSAGIDVESHGSTHAILTGLADGEVRAELERARSTLEGRGLGRHGLFAYPSGRFDDRVARIVAEVGHRAAFTLVGGVASRDADAMRIPRVGVHDGMGRTAGEFLFKIPRSAFGRIPPD